MSDASIAELFERAMGDCRSMSWTPSALSALRYRGVRDALLVTASHGNLDWRLLGMYADTTIYRVDEHLKVLTAEWGVPVPQQWEIDEALGHALEISAMCRWRAGYVEEALDLLSRCPNNPLASLLTEYINKHDRIFYDWAGLLLGLSPDKCLAFARQEAGE